MSSPIDIISDLTTSFNNVRVSNYSIFEDYIEETCKESYMSRMFNEKNLRIDPEPIEVLDNKYCCADNEEEDYYCYDNDNEEEQTLEEYYNESYNSDLDLDFE